MTTTTDAREVLFGRLFDDAGLFPPACKSMRRAVSDHQAAREGPHAWMLGRFLCPVSRLAEFATAAPDAQGWQLSAVFDGPAPSWSAALRSNLERVGAYQGAAPIVAVEARLPGGVALREIGMLVEGWERAHLPSRVDAFLEIAAGPDHDTVTALRALAESAETLAVRSPFARLAAKIRCGGPKGLPPPASVAVFIREARELNLTFKATAGLHNPFRVNDESAGALQHGFVNLLAATSLDVEMIEQILTEPHRHAFELNQGELTWTSYDPGKQRSSEHTAGLLAIERSRALFTAIGSCSFDEPVDQLIAHRLLPPV